MFLSLAFNLGPPTASSSGNLGLGGLAKVPLGLLRDFDTRKRAHLLINRELLSFQICHFPEVLRCDGYIIHSRHCRTNPEEASTANFTFFAGKLTHS